MPAVTADTLTLPRLAAAPDARPRTVLGVVTAPKGFEGEGFPVHRAFAGIKPEFLDPFIHMDQMGEVEYAPGEPKGTPWHPHRGFETFTYLIDGQFLHQDSNGGGGIINDGGTQYMTAGDGILHIETPPEDLVESGGLFHGVQLWINLPRAKKRIAPQYQDLQGLDSSMVTNADGGALLRVLAGEVDGHSGPGISHTPLAITHLTLAPGAEVDIPWRHDFNALAYVLAGSGTIGADAQPIRSGQTAVLADGDTVRVRADARQESRSPSLEVFLIGGVPLREPVVQYGPFVMSTEAEIRQAFDDYQSGRLGTVPADAIQPHRPGQ
ncbi:MAG: pirin-like C-terminal cupin domain-containing protein [Actinomycetota bacterium]|nr:pirin-like C-terminal cupin domain-containing protein [Actinomycetota bacterium]